MIHNYLLLVGCLLISFQAPGEMDDSFQVKNPLLVSAEELEIVRDEALPRELRQLPKYEFKKAVDSQSLNLKDWAQSLEKENLSALCVGESHSNVYRNFIGEELLSVVRFSSLSLEMKPNQLIELRREYQETGQVKWLSATMTSVFRSAHGKPFFAIESTKEQGLAGLKEKLSAPNTKTLSRDGFIAKNFLQVQKPPGLNIIVYGAHHCANFDIGLPLEVPMFRRIKNVLGSKKAKSVFLLPWSRLDHPLVAYFSAAGVKKSTFVLKDFAKIPPEVFNYRFDLVKYQQNYDYILFVADR